MWEQVLYLAQADGGFREQFSDLIAEIEMVLDFLRDVGVVEVVVIDAVMHDDAEVVFSDTVLDVVGGEVIGILQM